MQQSEIGSAGKPFTSYQTFHFDTAAFKRMNEQSVIAKHLHESSARCCSAFVPRHAEHRAADLKVGAAGIVSDTLSHKHNRFQDAGRIRRLISQKDNSTRVSGYHGGCTVHAREQRIFLQQSFLVGYNLHRHVRTAEQLRKVLFDSWGCHSFGICATCRQIA